METVLKAAWVLALVGVIAALNGCGAEPVTQQSDEADCVRIAELADTGRPLAEMDAEVSPPLPDGIDEVLWTRIERVDEPSESAPQIGIGRPDRYADILVGVAEADDDLANVEQAFTTAVESRGMAVGSGHSSKSNGRTISFGRTYRGPDASGNASGYTCGDDKWMVFHVDLVPAVPDSASDPLPGCADIVDGFPAEIYVAPTYFADPDLADERDDDTESWRRCRVRDADSTSSDIRTVIEVRRLPPAPDSWRDRMQTLNDGAEGFVEQSCSVARSAEALPDGPAGAVWCADDHADGVMPEAAVATVVDNDYWIGVRQYLEADSGDEQQALSTATRILEAVRP